MRLKTFIILCLIAIFIPFLLGIIHPWAVFWWYGILFFSSLPFLVLLVVFFACLIVSLLTKKNRKTAATRLIATFVLFQVAIQLLSTSAFNGMYLHYKMVNGYDQIRPWAKSVELVENGYSYFSQNETPSCVTHFKPMHCSVYEVDSARVTNLSWGSGMLGVNYSLLITEPDVDKKMVQEYNDYSEFRKIKPGVYLTYSSH